MQRWKRYINRLIAAEISAFSRYYDALIQWNPRQEDSGILYEAIVCPSKSRVLKDEPFPDLSRKKESRTLILLNGNFNYETDIQQSLTGLKQKLSRHCRIVVVGYNSYFRGLYLLANRLGIRRGDEPTTFVTRTDAQNLARLSGYELVCIRPVVYLPGSLFGLGSLLNKVLPSLPLLRWFSLAAVVILRPIIPEEGQRSLSVVIPARNEKGNLRPLLDGLSQLRDLRLELLFIEGHSTDETWEEFQRLSPNYSSAASIRSMKQQGVGKSDAVRLGMSEATGDLLTILDADLSMPPELIRKFYEAYHQGHADFLNGNRLVYPMHGNAMPFLNRLANSFFAKALSHLLGVRLGDTLCGTKMLARHDYRRFVAWRSDFGDFDPFGDFELLFPAAILALGVVDVPVRYRARTYGRTNIHRFSDGLRLLKMTSIGFFRVKLGRLP